MASFTMVFAPMVTTRVNTRVYAATAAKGAGGSKEEKGFIGWLGGVICKDDQLLEVDPILKKVEDKSGGTTGGRKNTVMVPPKKKGGFNLGGLFAKED
ncbi:uncharacterized protein LOC126787461 [Argentina anserina]|uniref:uncharacterized protein LOC126787461 n=1 Tax=Argentina anserina TaxID=57926 RepID=UPI0021761E8E|nr:uncharacterized protein LOC126787461 [Potentilla anserina]